jgi:multimeric flavodoxin WrbA
MEPVKRDLTEYNKLIVATPIWIHNISSPMRTFLKYSGLKGKSVWLVLTNNGNYNADDQHHIIQFVESLGITVVGCSSICTKGKSAETLRQHTHSLLGKITFPN